MTRTLSDIFDSFDAKYIPEPNSGCWIWCAANGGRDNRKYGYIRVSKERMIHAHIFSYFTYKGDVPKGLVLDHICKNSECVNPDHLEPVTHRVNILRGDGLGAKHARRTHCNKGHPFTEDNVVHFSSEIRRRCLICQRETGQRFRDRRKFACT